MINLFNSDLNKTSTKFCFLLNPKSLTKAELKERSARATKKDHERNIGQLFISLPKTYRKRVIMPRTTHHCNIYICGLIYYKLYCLLSISNYVLRSTMCLKLSDIVFKKCDKHNIYIKLCRCTVKFMYQQEKYFFLEIFNHEAHCKIILQQ